MKTIYLFMLALICHCTVLAQAKSTAAADIVYKTNGEQLSGKVVKVTDDDVTFVYTGEDAEYVLKKADIQKIVHASGRTETFSASGSALQERKDDAVAMSPSPADHHNKIAILPFSFLMDNQPGAQEVGLKAQQDTYTYLTKHSAGYTIVDPRTANALLNKAGVTGDKKLSFTMKEICDILGVEYVVDGSVTQNKGYQTTSSGGYIDTKVKQDGDKGKLPTNVNSSTSSYSSTAQTYDMSVSLAIFMDTNASIYNQSRKALFSNTDGSYQATLEYLLKRCPLYRK